MSRYFSSITNMFTYNSKVSENKVDPTTFDEKVTAAAQDEFVYMKEAPDCPDLGKIKSNDDILRTPAGQLHNAKGECMNGLSHASYAVGNALLAGGHGVAVAA